MFSSKKINRPLTGTVFTALVFTLLFAAPLTNLEVIAEEPGDLKWKYETGSNIHSSPAMVQDSTIDIGSWDNHIHAINPEGHRKWSYQTVDRIRSSPAVSSDGTIYVGSRDNQLYALNPDGTLKWKYETEGSVDSSPAVGSDGTVYVGSYDNSMQ